mmetsp:Transcript_155671/g.497696  ORF Transcript_155671/g.497696 Transcript_155671/m.497696 type:complete len:159 (-) Transcript_155671:40-516(-)
MSSAHGNKVNFFEEPIEQVVNACAQNWSSANAQEEGVREIRCANGWNPRDTSQWQLSLHGCKMRIKQRDARQIPQHRQSKKHARDIDDVGGPSNPSVNWNKQHQGSRSDKRNQPSRRPPVGGRKCGATNWHMIIPVLKELHGTKSMSRAHRFWRTLAR